MTYIQERGSTHVYHVNRMSKEEMDHMISLCVHEQPAYCVAACPFKADTKEMLFYAAKGNFKKALAIYEKITPFPMILCNGCMHHVRKNADSVSWVMAYPYVK